MPPATAQPAVPTDRTGLPLYAYADQDDEEPVLYVPERWPAINIDRFGQSRAYAFEVNHPEVLLDGALEYAVRIDAGIRALARTLETGVEEGTGRRLDPRGLWKVREALRGRRAGYAGLLIDVYNTMGSAAGEEFERRARLLTGRGLEEDEGTTPAPEEAEEPPGQLTLLR